MNTKDENQAVKGWKIDLRPNSRLSGGSTRDTVVFADEYERTHQLWFFRNECLVNLKLPWICLDPSSSTLDLAKFSGALSHVI